MKRDLAEFNQLWQRFLTQLYGKLIERKKAQPLNMSTANLELRQVSENWVTVYDISGKWLAEYTKAYPEKGARIREILQKEMRFSEEAKEKTMPTFLKYGIPFAGAFIGGVVAHAFSARFIVQAAAAGLSGVGVHLGVKDVEKNIAVQRHNNMPAAYLAQLEKHRLSIESVILQ